MAPPLEAEVITNRILKEKSKKSQKLSDKKAIYFLISYYGQKSMILAYRIKQICKKVLPLIEVNVCLKKTFTIKSIFLPLQKGLNGSKNKKLVYKISCLNCDKCYIGETSRQKDVRMKEHEADVRKFAESSNFAKYANTRQYSFDFARSETRKKS